MIRGPTCSKQMKLQLTATSISRVEKKIDVHQRKPQPNLIHHQRHHSRCCNLFHFVTLAVAFTGNIELPKENRQVPSSLESKTDGHHGVQDFIQTVLCDAPSIKRPKRNRVEPTDGSTRRAGDHASNTSCFIP
jgi:hypothetical protein